MLVYATQRLCAATKAEIKSSADYAVNEPPDIVPVAIRRSVVRVPIERAVVAAVDRVTADTRGTETGVSPVIITKIRRFSAADHFRNKCAPERFGFERNFEISVGARTSSDRNIPVRRARVCIRPFRRIVASKPLIIIDRAAIKHGKPVRIESFNAAIAAAIVMWEIVR